MIFQELNQYEYTIPEELIAQEHIEPRDSARLLVYHTSTGEIEHRIFRELTEVIPQDTRFVLNQTRVAPARLVLNRRSGGKVQILLLLNESEGADLSCVANRKLKEGTILYYQEQPVIIITSTKEKHYKAQWLSKIQLREFLDQYGTTPLPPYIKHNTQSEQARRSSYQTVFAETIDKYSSVAAPTASLHFSEEMMRGVRANYVTVDVELAVGLGTFSTLKEENFVTGKLHKEWVRVLGGEYAKLHNHAHVLAVGTTSLRTLESIDEIVPNTAGDRVGWTELFVTPPHHFRYADMLLTNFHVPCSSLMLLVEAFLQDRGAKHSLVEIYKIAIEHGYKFYSLGDAMLIVE
jgi:S-adenosylmethionine:tRNA ribosyltransferase-isomerase